MTKRNPKPGKILFAGGGTGGHVFPMIAVAQAVLQLSRAEVLFVGTERGLEAKIVPEHGYPIRFMRVLPLRGGGVAGAAKGLWRAAAAVREARTLLLVEQPSIVFSAGGYAAGPISLAARTLGIPVVLLEPNSVAGLANRLMAPFVQRAYTAFERCERHFSRPRVLRLGVPIRSGFLRAEYSRAVGGAGLRVLVMGGSQGARTLNEVVPQALARVAGEVEVRHQCGRDSVSEVERSYDAFGMSGRVQVLPFLDDMAGALSWSQLVISRSGASAVSEICAVGRPSLLVPFPFAAGDHQRYNAEALSLAGAAVSMLNAEATPDAIGALVVDFLRNPARLAQMAERAAELGRPNAALEIAADLLSLAGIPAGEPGEPSETPENLANRAEGRDNDGPVFRFSEVR